MFTLSVYNLSADGAWIELPSRVPPIAIEQGGREGGLGLGNKLIRDQGEVPAMHHTLREISHDGVRLAM